MTTTVSPSANPDAATSDTLDPGEWSSASGGFLGLSFTGANAVTLFQNDVGWALGDNDGFGRSLAAGYYDTADGGEDLIIGSPTDNSNGGPSFSGVISVVFGGPNGPGGHGYGGWAQDAFSDDIAQFDDFGQSLAVGKFDATNRGNLAVGAPGEDSNTGQVVIVAPWRQTPYAGFRNGIAIDCEGNWIYAQKPFDEVQIASTTKIMTVFLACERMALPTNDPNYVSPNASYTVPDWIRENIGGSRYEFAYSSVSTSWDLLYCCIFPSGNDAAYAIADLLTGSNNIWTGAYDTTCPLFVAEMNDARRAARHDAHALHQSGRTGQGTPLLVRRGHGEAGRRGNGQPDLSPHRRLDDRIPSRPAAWTGRSVFRSKTPSSTAGSRGCRTTTRSSTGSSRAELRGPTARQSSRSTLSSTTAPDWRSAWAT